AQPPHDVAPGGRFVRARVIDRDLGALAGQQIHDVDRGLPPMAGSRADVRPPDAVARFIERFGHDLGPLHCMLSTPSFWYWETVMGNELVVAALSGGVDSATAAGLLVEQG